MPGWTPGFLGASSRPGVPTGQAQLKGDVSSFQIRTTEPWADGHPQWSENVWALGSTCHRNVGEKTNSWPQGHPALHSRLVVSLLPQDTGQHPASSLGSFWKEAGQPTQPAPCPPQCTGPLRALNRAGGACAWSSSSCSALGTEGLRQGPGLGGWRRVGSKGPPGRRDPTRWKWCTRPWW